jgi:cardiolipin synthase
VNIPNILSVIRLALVPAFVAVFFADLPKAHVYAGSIFILASLTDALDGFIARKFGMVTRLGRVLDPLADKLMTAAALVCITIAGILPVWIFIVFAVKEMLMGIGALVMYKRIDDVLPSNYLGKAASVVFFVFCLVLMLFNIPRPYSTAMLSAALVFAILAFIRYAIRFYDTTVKRQVGSEGEEESRSEV